MLYYFEKDNIILSKQRWDNIQTQTFWFDFLIKPFQVLPFMHH